MKRIIDNLRQKWKGLAPQRRIMLVAVVATLAIGAYVVNSRVNQVDWAVLYANVDDKTASDILAKLDAHGIQHKLDGNGTRILVPKAGLDTTRLTMASAGVTGQTVPAGFAEIFDKQGLATTDFAQKVNYQRGLEGELAKTLMTMDPVQGATVQLSIPDKSVFIGQQASATDKPGAAVTLNLRRALTNNEVATVGNLIASSVPGLTVDNVTIAATDGSLLKAAGGGDLGGSGGAASTLELTQKYENDLSARLTTLVRKMTGSTDASVSVSATLDFTQSTVDQQQMSPDSTIVTAQQSSSEDWTGDGSTVGGTVGVDGGPVDSTTGAGTGTYSKKSGTQTNEPTDKKITHSVQNTPAVTKMGIAIVIPQTAPDGTALDTQAIQNAVTSAAGYDPTNLPATVSVQQAYLASVASTVPTSLPTVTPTGPTTTVIGGGVGGLAVLILFLFMFLKRRKKKQAATAVATTESGTMMLPVTEDGKGRKGKKVKTKKKKGKGDEADELFETLPVMHDHAADKVAMDEIRSDLEKILEESPESLATLLSSWMTK